MVSIRRFQFRRATMFGARWQLFRLLGIPVSVDLSWLIILALLTLSYAEIFPASLHDLYHGETANPQYARLLDHGPGHRTGFLRLHCPARIWPCLVARSRGCRSTASPCFCSEEYPSSVRSRARRQPNSSWPSRGLLSVPSWPLFFGSWSLSGPPGRLAASRRARPVLPGCDQLMVLIFNMIPAFPLDGGRVLRRFCGRHRQCPEGDRWASGSWPVFAGYLSVWAC